MAVPTYCGKCLRSLGSPANITASFDALKTHMATCPGNAAEGNKNIPATVLQELNPFFPIWTLIQALF